MTTIDVPGLPWSLTSDGPPSATRPVLLPDGVVLSAGPLADLFLDPAGTASPPDAERWLAPVTGDVLLSARVTVDFRSTFDSGVLLGYVDDATWFKVCAELGTDGRPRVVSVVTRDGASDDANGWVMAHADVHLRVARLGRAFALHASDDGCTWELVRYFTLGLPDACPIRVGLLAQSPTGDGCAVRFEQVRFHATRLTDVRDGS